MHNVDVHIEHDDDGDDDKEEKVCPASDREASTSSLACRNFRTASLQRGSVQESI